MNETLKPLGIKIADVRVDLADGVKFAQFLENLIGKKLHARLDTKATQRIQKIQNLVLALKFMDAEMGVKNPGCSAEGILSLERFW